MLDVIQSAPGRRTPTTGYLTLGLVASFSWFFHTSGSDNLNRRWITNLFDFLSELLGWDGDLAHPIDDEAQRLDNEHQSHIILYMFLCYHTSRCLTDDIDVLTVDTARLYLPSKSLIRNRKIFRPSRRQPLPPE